MVRRGVADAVDEAARVLSDASRLLVLTGSGMSAESGIPTFRGPEGLWEGQRPEDVATAAAFERDPERVWRWYRERILTHRQAKPNAGHAALAAMEAAFEAVLVATQNVDGLHEAAGSSRVVHLHGSMTHLRCHACTRRVRLDARQVPVTVPRCDACGGRMRPDVTWFGELLPPDAWRHADEAARRADACLAVGSSHMVYPAAMLPLTAKEAGATVVEVNPSLSGLTAAADVVVEARAAEALPRIAARLGGGAKH